MFIYLFMLHFPLPLKPHKALRETCFVLIFFIGFDGWPLPRKRALTNTQRSISCSAGRGEMGWAFSSLCWLTLPGVTQSKSNRDTLPQFSIGALPLTKCQFWSSEVPLKISLLSDFYEVLFSVQGLPSGLVFIFQAGLWHHLLDDSLDNKK